MGAVPRDCLRTTKRGLARLLVLGLLGGPVFILLMNLAVSSSGATIAAFVSGLYAVLASVMAPFALRERLGRGAFAGFVVALAGTALLAHLDVGSAPAPGIAEALLAAIAFALFLVLLRRWTARATETGEPSLAGEAVALAAFLSTAGVLLIVEVVGEPARILPAAVAPEAIVALAWLAVGPGVLSQLLVAASARRIPVRRSAAFLLLNPLTAAIVAAILLGETLAPIQLAGGGLVLLGIGLATGAFEAFSGRQD